MKSKSNFVRQDKKNGPSEEINRLSFISLQNLELELGFGSQWCRPKRQQIVKKSALCTHATGYICKLNILALNKGVVGQGRSPHAPCWIILVIFIWENSNFRDIKGDVWFVQFGREVAGNTFGLDMLRAADES